MQNYLDQFQQYWAQFSQTLRLNTAQSESLFLLLNVAYSQNFYHTHQHIVECLDLFHQIKTQLDDPVAVELAIWFHDVIYDPQASENEQQSADFMQKHGVGILAKAELEKVARWIIATKEHLPTTEHDLQYVLDIDLAILGASAPRFTEYEQQIQQEYAWVNPVIYQQKRMEVLETFAQMEPLYQTDYFRQNYEVQAKINLNNALKSIKTQVV